jgi:protein SCO1/2
MKLPVLAIALTGVLAVGMLAVAVTRVAMPGEPAFHGTAYSPPEPAADFRLTDHTGADAALSDFHGTPVLLFFGFTNCPDVCPLTLQRLDRILQSVDADTTAVRVLLVTVDPERDTPEQLARYVSRFGGYVTGLTGDSATLADVRRAYGVYAGEHPTDPRMAMTHTPAVFGIDAAGQLRVLLPMEREDESVREDIRTLMDM